MAPTLDLNDLGQPRDVASTTRRFFPKYTGPTLYVAGGDGPLTTALGIGKIFAVLGLTLSNGTVILLGYYDATADKIKWFDMAGAEASGDLSTYSGHIEVIGQ